MKKRIFYKYIIAFASFFIVPLILLFMCLQYIMYANLEKDIMTYNQNIMERLGADILTINSRLMESGNAISFSTTILSDLSQSENQSDMIKVLMKENIDNPYSKKMYLFYNQGEYSFSSSGKYELNDILQNKMNLSKEDAALFFKAVFEGDVEKARYMTVQKTYELNSQITKKNQLLFIYPVKNYMRNSKAWIVMEVNENNLSSSINIAPGNYSKDIFIANYEGDILFSQNRNIDYAQYISQVDESVKASEDIAVIRKNEKILLYPLEKVDMVLGDVVTTPNLYFNVLQKNTPLVTFVLLFLLMGCCFAIYAAYRYYKPIRQLAQYMSQENEISTEVDEFTYMKTQYDKVNLLKEKITDELERQWPMIEEHLITRLLFDGSLEEDETDMLSDIMKNELGEHHFIVYTLQEKQMSDEYDPSSFYEMYKRYDKKWKDNFQQEYVVYTTYLHYYNAIVIILGGLQEQLLAGLPVFQNRIQDTIKEETRLMEMGYGNIHENISGIHISFLEAMASTQYSKENLQSVRFKMMQNKEESKDYEKQITTYQIENLLLIKGCLDNGNIEDINQIADKVVLSMEELPEYMKLMCCYDIINQLIRELPKYHIPISEVKLFEITRFETSEEFGEKLKEVLKKLCQCVLSIRQDRQDDLIQLISQYIDENFKNPDLSLVEMADAFHFSSSYLSKFIGQNFNESFTDIVTRKRVEYTKECLIDTDKQIAQIAREAGYSNISNFTRRFKNLENMTPGQYRNLYKKEE